MLSDRFNQKPLSLILTDLLGTNAVMKSVKNIPNSVIVLVCLSLLSMICTPGFAADYYWVGGSGNWSDIRHWVTSSGGTIQHASVPSTSDNVFFDDQSFTTADQTVIVDFPLVFCRTMDWSLATNNPELRMPETSILNIGGSLILQTDMQWNVEGDVHLVGTEAGFSIETNGHNLHRQLIFDAGGSGDWSLASDLAVDSTIVFRGGNWSTADFDVLCERLHLVPGTTSKLNLGLSSFTIIGTTNNKKSWIEDPPMLVRTDYLNVDAANASFIFPSSIADLRAFGGPNVNLGHVTFTSPFGLSSINDDRYSPYPPGGFAGIEFESLSFTTNGYLGVITDMGDLTLSSGKSYIYGSTLPIGIESITAIGTCPEPISIFARYASSQALWQARSDQILAYVNVRGIVVSGATYTASEAIDLGNNRGWQFAERAAGDLYWIGGNGSWSDPMHWSLSSGGPAAGCIPSAVDDVYFDNNSFPNNNNTVRIDIDDPLCHSMFWSADGKTPSLIGPQDSKIHIFGSLTLQSDMNLSFAGEFVFESKEDGQTITSNGIILPNNAVFNGVGEYILLDAMEVTDSIIFNAGTINTNDQALTFESFLSITDQTRELILGSSYLTARAIPYGSTQWRINAQGFSLDAGTSTLEFRAGIYGSTFYHSEMSTNLYYYRVLLNSGNDYVGQQGVNGFRLHIRYMEFFSSGQVVGDLSIETLKLNAGFAYTFGEKNSENLFVVDTLLADGTCDRPIRIESFREGVPITLASNHSYDVQNVILHSVNFESSNGIATAHQSIRYSSFGWILPEEAKGRDLYWVGDGGEWHDRNHWSLTSGGPGGECIPTPIDTVYFDDNSFPTPGQSVRVNSFSEPDCHTFLWSNSETSHQLSLTGLNLYGSIYIQSEIPNFYINELNLRGPGEENEIDLKEHFVNYVSAKGTGDWKIISDVNCRGITLYRGTLHLGEETNIEIGSAINCPYDAVDATLIGGTAHVIIQDGGFFSSADNQLFTLIAEQFTLELAGPYNYIHTTYPHDFHNVVFSNSTGRGEIETSLRVQPSSSATFNRLEFRNDGIILDQNEFDSLLFTPGHVYTLESRKEQTINDYWRIRGNNCGLIQLRSNIPGIKAQTRMNAGKVNGDFIQMSDQEAVGGAEFSAGSRSTNVNSSNAGWIFEQREDFVDYGILGEDIVLCDLDSLVLNEDASIGANAYRWQDGTNMPSFAVTRPGLYFVEATFDSDGSPCIFSDSIRILEPSDFQVDLGGDQVLCANDTALLNGSLDLVGITYLWDNGLDAPTRTIEQPGIYKLTATLTGCSTSDSLEVDYVEIPKLSGDQSSEACEGEVIELDVTFPGATYSWSTGETTSAIQANTTGAYRVTVISSGCEATDTFQLTFISPPVFDLGADLTECEGRMIELDATTSNATYLWDDSTTSGLIEFEAIEDRVRYVDVSFGSCSSRDSIRINVLPIPEVMISPDQLICPGEQTSIRIDHNADSIIWSTGEITDYIETGQVGSYQVTVFKDGCTNSATSKVDRFETAFKELPSDTIICHDRTISLDVGIENGSYIWSDGSIASSIEVGEGVYTVEVNDGNCTFTDSIYVDVRRCIYFSAYHPNVFTPNYDELNDEWKPLIPNGIQISSYQLQVFDRWGGLVFHTNDPFEAWNGMTDGKPMPNGVYIGSTVMEYIDDNGPSRYEKASDFTLIR